MIEMKTKALAPWFGSNRILAATVGRELDGCKWVGIPFVGGCCELPYIKCRGGVASDLHRHIINLARVVSIPRLKAELVARLDAALFHPDELMTAQARCRSVDEALASDPGLFGAQGGNVDSCPVVDWAYDYFVSVWMARSGTAGTDGEFNGSLSTRWNAGGGGSNVRFRSAAAALDGWHGVLKRWEFETLDVFDFLDRIEERPDKDGRVMETGRAIYVDAPWPKAGDGYKHKFTEAMQRRLATKLGTYKRIRVVIRFGDHPLIRDLYTEDRWTWIRQTSRTQQNDDCAEVLIINGPSKAVQTGGDR